MTEWSPMTLEKLREEVRLGESQLEPTMARLWNAVRIERVKWKLSPWGDYGGGFWVVGLIGNQVLWYNDIEGGFNWSLYSAPGVIDEYWCNQDGLSHSMHQLQDRLDGKAPTYKLGPPQPIPRDEG